MDKRNPRDLIAECKRCGVGHDALRQLLQEPVHTMNFAMAAFIVNSCPVCKTEFGELLKQRIQERDTEMTMITAELVSDWQGSLGKV